MKRSDGLQAELGEGVHRVAGFEGILLGYLEKLPRYDEPEAKGCRAQAVREAMATRQAVQSSMDAFGLGKRALLLHLEAIRMFSARDAIHRQVSI